MSLPKNKQALQPRQESPQQYWALSRDANSLNLQAHQLSFSGSIDLDRVNNAFKQFNAQMLNTTSSYVKSELNGERQYDGRLSVLCNKEIDQCIKNLQWNIGLLKPGALTGTIGEWIAERTSAATMSDADKEKILGYIQYDTAKLTALLETVACVKELQYAMEHGDYETARKSVPFLQKLIDESDKIGRAHV
jgi:hypothetical protein